MYTDLLPEIRIFGYRRDGTQEKLEHYNSLVVPRIGDRICIEYWSAEVYKVEWTIIDGVPKIDIYCDTLKAYSDAVEKIKKKKEGLPT